MYPKPHNSYSNNRISYLPLKFLSHFNIGDSARGETASSFLSCRNRIMLDRECLPNIRDKFVREACSMRILLQPGDNFTRRLSVSGVRCAVALPHTSFASFLERLYTHSVNKFLRGYF